MRETLRSLASWKKHKLCLSMSYYYTNTKSTRKERQAYSLLLQTTMEPLPHGLWSCSSKPLTGRTGLQTEGRFSLLELLEIQPYQRNTPTTGQGLIATADDMPCRHPLH